MIAGPRLVGSTVAPTRQPDHVAFAGAPGGDVRVIEETMAPREDRQRGGRTRTIFLAREGRSETRAATDLEFVPVSPGGSEFTLMYRGQPLPRASLEVAGPPGWLKKLRTDAEGRVALPLPWAGRYVADAQHLVEERGGEGEGAHDRVRYVATLSFMAEQGLPWVPPR
jgi:hypothetical protein